MYIMWRYFDEQLCDMNIDLARRSEAANFNCTSYCANKMQLLEQKLKDYNQSNAVCLKSCVDRINSRIATLEKQGDKPHGRTTSRKTNA
jgi:hypothetical protein